MADDIRALRLARIDSMVGGVPKFAPYLMLGTIPWLLAATVLRLYVKAAPGGIALLLLPFVQIAVLIAFLVASERMITLSKGGTSLGALTVKEKARFACQVVWRLLLFFFAVVMLAIGLGIDKFAAAGMWFGIDGLAFPWRQGILQVWVAFVAIAAFLFILEKGMGRDPGYLNVVKQLITHRRNLLASWAYIALFLMVMTFVQAKLAYAFGYFLDRASLGGIERFMFIAYVTAFSYIRIWAVVAILTYAIRASYNRLQAGGQTKTASDPTL